MLHTWITSSAESGTCKYSSRDSFDSSLGEAANIFEIARYTKSKVMLDLHRDSLFATMILLSRLSMLRYADKASPLYSAPWHIPYCFRTSVKGLPLRLYFSLLISSFIVPEIVELLLFPIRANFGPRICSRGSIDSSIAFPTPTHSGQS